MVFPILIHLLSHILSSLFLFLVCFLEDLLYYLLSIIYSIIFYIFYYILCFSIIFLISRALSYCLNIYFFKLSTHIFHVFGCIIFISLRMLKLVFFLSFFERNFLPLALALSLLQHFFPFFFSN